MNGKSIGCGTVAAMLLVAGCGTDQGTGLLALSISADGSIPPAAATSLVLSLEGKKTRTWPGTFPPIGGGAVLLQFPNLPASDSPTNITVQAFDSGNCLVGVASKPITIKAGEKTSSDIVLGRSTVACGDGAAQPVADAMADGAGRVDLPQLAGDGAQAAEAGLDGNFLRDSTGQDASDTPQSAFFDGGQTADGSDSARSEVVDVRAGAEIQDDTPIGGGDVIGGGGVVGSGGAAGHGSGGTTGAGGMASSGGIAGGGSGGINGAGGVGITGGVTSPGSGGTGTGGIVASGGVAGDGSGGINGTGGVTGSGGITNPGSGGTGTGGTGSGGTGGTGGTSSTCAGTVCGQDCCSAGQRCSGGTCICDADSCTDGCCQDRVCVGYSNQDNSRCGSAGGSCQPCPAAAQACESGQCNCPPGQSPCGTSCVDKQNDSSNCGGCGNACAAGQRCVGGQCTCDAASCSNGCCAANTCYDYASQDVSRCGAGGGSCGPCSINAPSTVTCALGRCLATLAIDALPCSITVDSSYVYWTNWQSTGKVRKAPIGGGNSSDVYVGASGDQPAYIINDAGYLYFGTSDNHSRNLLIKASKSGGGSTLVNLGSTSLVGFLGQDAGYIYLWEEVAGGGARLDKVSKSTGSITPSSWVTTYATTPMVYGSTIYWYSSAHESTRGTIQQSSTALAAPSTLVPDIGDPMGLAVDASGLYVTDYTGLVRRVSPSDGEITLLASGQAPSTIVSDDSSLYWINPGNGTVMKMSKGGGDPVVLASISSGQLAYFGGLAIDGTSVYVSMCSGFPSDSIMKITPK